MMPFKSHLPYFRKSLLGAFGHQTFFTLCLIGILLVPGAFAQTPPDTLTALIAQAEQHYRNDPAQAIEAGRQALRLLARYPNADHLRQVLFHKGQAHDYLRQNDSVRVYADQLAALNDDLAQAHGALLAGRVYLRDQLYDEAATTFERARATYKTARDWSGQAMAWDNLCIIYRRQQTYKKAHEACEQALSIKERLGDTRGRAVTLTNLARLENEQGHDEAVLRHYQQALPLYEASGDTRGQAVVLYRMGSIQLEKEAYDEAVVLLKQALARREEIGDAYYIATTLHYLGIAHEEQGDYANAYTYHSRALEIREEIGHQWGVAASLNQLGDLYEDQGDFRQAQAFFQRAYQVFKELDDKPGMAATLNNTGLTFVDLGQFDDALAVYNESLGLSKEMGDQERVARAYDNMGTVYRKKGDYETALTLHKRALPLFEAEKSREDIVQVKKNLGKTYTAIDRLDEALAITNEALALADSIGALPQIREVHLLRSEILERQGHFEEALDAYRAYKTAEDTLFSAESQGVIAELQQQYRTREQQRQIEVLEQRRRQQRWWLVAALIGIGLLMAIVGLMTGRIRLRRQALEATEQARRAEAKQAADLRQANEFQSRFLANISHEFRTPLTLTFGPINDVLDGRYQIEETALPHFERARQNGHRLLRLINQLLELSRLDAGALHLSAHRYDLARHLREIAALFQDIAHHRRLDFSTHLPDAPVWHVFDADKIEKVVINLLSNAVKFTPPGGAVSLSLTWETDSTARIVVADTGLGIAAEHQTHLFDRFYQVENTETRAYEGSGIGLALVKELVALHQGRITIESVPGEGATFTVYLPTLEETDEEILSPAQHQGDGSPAMAPAFSSNHLDMIEEPLAVEPENMSTAPEEHATVVLIVEDNADMRAYIRSHLETDYTILEAANGQAGLEQAKQWVPDLVLSDVMMPKMDGLTLTEALKQDVRTSHIPVVLLTAKEEVEHRIAGFASGADAYLPKPFDAEELGVRVRGLIEERRRLRSLFAGSDAAPQEATAALPASEQVFLAEVHDYVVHHMNDADFSVDDLAEGLHLSRRQLLRKLQALTDESPGALLRRMRLEQAIVLLREGASAKEVAHAVGFRDYSAFWRAFNKVYGTSPTAYLENI